jgi:DNA end-binding protein Ku
MARPIWTGSIGFGLVNVPVSLFAATEDHSVHFHQLERGTADRIRYRRVNERTGEEVPRERIVRGLDVGDGEYVVLDDDELDAIAPERSKSIEILDFVDLSEIDPVYYDTTYYLAPRGEAAERAYALLRAAMERTQKVGVALFVLRGRERVVAVRPEGQTLALETMFFADEVRDPESELPDLPAAATPGTRELETAQLLVDSLSTRWDPARYESSYRNALAELIERKRRGETVRVVAGSTAGTGKVVDLMEALSASLAAARGTADRAEADGSASASRGRGGGGGRGGGSGKAGARKRGTAPDYAAMTKAQLQSIASELDIAGRSKMSRDELERGVRRAAERRAS